MTCRTTWPPLLLLGAVLLRMVPAVAQEVGALEEVTVTARKREDRWPSMANLAETLRTIPAKRPKV